MPQNSNPVNAETEKQSCQEGKKRGLVGWFRGLSKGGKIALLIMIPTVILAVYIMAHSLGLSPDLDFGAGAYYYADMPNFQRWTDGSAYHSPVPMWALILLFLAWGWVMWKFWVWIDRKEKKDH